MSVIGLYICSQLQEKEESWHFLILIGGGGGGGSFLPTAFRIFSDHFLSENGGTCTIQKIGIMIGTTEITVLG